MAGGRNATEGVPYRWVGTMTGARTAMWGRRLSRVVLVAIDRSIVVLIAADRSIVKMFECLALFVSKYSEYD